MGNSVPKYATFFADVKKILGQTTSWSHSNPKAVSDCIEPLSAIDVGQGFVTSNQ